MKLKRILAISLSLTMLFSMSLSSVAEGEIRTTPVEVPDEYDKTDVVVDSDVKVVGNDYAVRVVNEGQSEGVTTFADIFGNVSLTNTVEATALDSSAYTEGTDIFVNGSVDAHTDNGEATAIHVSAGNNGDASVLVDRNVTATADKGCATGVSVYTEESSVNVYVRGDVTVDSKDEKYGAADGIIIKNLTSTVDVKVGGSVNVKSKTDDAGGIIIVGSSTAEVKKANSTVTIHGDLNVEGYGVVSAGTADQSQADVIIEGTLDATKGAVLLKDYKSNSGSSNDESKKSDLNLYVWKINDHGAPIAQRMINDPGSSAAPEIKSDEDFINNNIYYIIKVEQPIEGGYFYVTDKNGNSLTKKNGNIVAKEGTVLLLKTDLEADYVINEAYGDISKNLSLVKDESGDYSLVVKRGGGVYFNALCSKPISNAEFRRREEVQDAIGFIAGGPKNSGNITIACFNSNSIDSSVVEAISEQLTNYRKKLKNFTVTILCMKDDVYGKIVIDSGDLIKHRKYDGSVDLSDLYSYFTPITNDEKRSLRK